VVPPGENNEGLTDGDMERCGERIKPAWEIIQKRFSVMYY